MNAMGDKLNPSQLFISQAKNNGLGGFYICVENGVITILFCSLLMCHFYLAEDTAGFWFCSSLSSFSLTFSSDNFEVRFLNLRNLDLDFFSLSSSGVFLTEVPSFLFLSELTPSSRPVRDRHVDYMIC